MKCIAKNKHGYFLTARRATGRLYENRSGWSADINDAKIFGTKGAATNSAKQSGEDDFLILEVEISVKGESS